MRLAISESEPHQQSMPGYWPAAIVFTVVIIACLFGIWSRPVGFLASIWPANAIMLGVLLRLPGAARWSGWAAGAAAFMAADLLTGASLYKASLLNSANIASIAVAYMILSRLPTKMIQLRQPLSMLFIVLAATLAGTVAGIMGGFAYPLLFNGDHITGFILWWVSEIVNYVAILPIFLAAPTFQDISKLSARHITFRKSDIAPALAVILSCVVVFTIGGPGAIAFPILALLWCGLVYPVFLTAILTLLCSLFALFFISSGHFPQHVEDFDLIALFSIRLGVSIIAIAPISLSIVIRNRNELLAELRYLSTHDALTGVGNRVAFTEEAEKALSETHSAHAVMMIDLDHFKIINDTYGHAAGDKVLREAARRISSCLRADDKLGRLGGEEFAVLLRHCQPAAAKEIAERIRETIAHQPVSIEETLVIGITTSIGLTFTQPQAGKPLNALLAEADAALYTSKEKGRNRVESALHC